MRTKLLICVVILTVVSFGAGKTYACCDDPVASFSAPDSVYCGEEVTFDGSASYDRDRCAHCHIRSWLWDFGDDTTGTGEIVTHTYSTTGDKTVRLTVWDNDRPYCCGYYPGCEDKDDSDSQSITVLSVVIQDVTSDKDGACDDCDIEFEVTTSPSGQEDNVSWSAPGGDPSTGSGPTFVTHWDTTGTKTVTASICESDGEKQVTVAAPTNFHLVEWWDIGGGQIRLLYEWDSTSGDWQHLEGCDVGEEVIYPGSPPYYVPPDPPFDNWSFPNPTVDWVDAVPGWLLDTHWKAGGFSKPYCSVGFTAYQWYRYRDCTGSITDLMGPLDIIRQVYKLVVEWYYSTDKGDASATAQLPP